MDVEKGCVVKSTAGRDKGKLSVVSEVTRDYVLICDGKERSLQKPKRKNPRHLSPAGISLNTEETETDRALRKALAQLKSECNGITKEG